MDNATLPAPHNRQLRAVLMMLACVGVFSAMDVVLKLLSAHYPPMQVASLRGASSLPWLLVWAAATPGLRPLLRVRWSLHLLRGSLGIMMVARSDERRGEKECVVP